MTIKTNLIANPKCNHILNPLNMYLMCIYDLLSLSCHNMAYLNFKIRKMKNFLSSYVRIEKWQNVRVLICSNEDLSFGLFSHLLKCFNFRSMFDDSHLMIIIYLCEVRMLGCYIYVRIEIKNILNWNMKLEARINHQSRKLLCTVVNLRALKSDSNYWSVRDARIQSGFSGDEHFIF